MYTPSVFNVTDRQAIHDFVMANNFGVLISSTPGEAPTASHLPFVFDMTHGPQGRLCAHMARANPHWKALETMHDKVEEALVIFGGAHGYVSPNYYEPGPAVPTWNYEAAHIYGVPSVVTTAEETRHALDGLATHHERGFEEPWVLDKEDPQFIEKMMAGIVAFEIDITRIEMKAKMSQNKSHATQNSIVEHLKKSAHAQDTVLADRMTSYLTEK